MKINDMTIIIIIIKSIVKPIESNLYIVIKNISKWKLRYFTDYVCKWSEKCRIQKDEKVFMCMKMLS